MTNNPITDDENSENLRNIDNDVEEANDPAVGEEETQLKKHVLTDFSLTPMMTVWF